MPGTKTLSNYLRLVRPWVTEENLMLPLYLTSTVPNCILKHMPSAQGHAALTSSKKLLLQQMKTVTENHSGYNRDKWIMGSTAPTHTFTTQLLYLRNIEEEGLEKL